MYEVIFEDVVHGTQVECFDSFEEAAEFWDEYADSPTCKAGTLTDLSNGEILWAFEDGAKE